MTWTNADSKTKVVELNNVVFPSSDDKFRVRMTTSSESLPTSIWLESKQTKAQWQYDLTTLETSFITSFLPHRVLVRALEQALVAQAKKSSANSCVIDVMSYDNRLFLHLKVKILDEYSEPYSFEMAPVALNSVGIMESKLRAMEEEVAELKKQRTRAALEVRFVVNVWLTASTVVTLFAFLAVLPPPQKNRKSGTELLMVLLMLMALVFWNMQHASHFIV
ncbi:hypothetical protein AC1031_007938 [Aphanomyces cochlioides]|nr:hypothetical protein AC1031_007938 [Aphanomyces cochlioides]